MDVESHTVYAVWLAGFSPFANSDRPAWHRYFVESRGVPEPAAPQLDVAVRGVAEVSGREVKILVIRSDSVKS